MEITCGVCHTQSTYGVLVCKGCGGTVAYGATSTEMQLSAAVGAFFGAIAFSEGSDLIGVSLSLTGLAIAAGSGLFLGAYIMRQVQRGSVRTFHQAVANR